MVPLGSSTKGLLAFQALVQTTFAKFYSRLIFRGKVLLDFWVRVDTLPFRENIVTGKPTLSWL